MVRKILLFTLACFVIVTLVAVFANLGDSSSAPAITTKRPGTSTSVTASTTAPTTTVPTITAPTTTVPTTTVPTTTAPPEPELTPGEMLAREITPWYQSGSSYQTDDGFYLAAGDRSAAYVPVEVAEKGIYRITVDVDSTEKISNYYAAYITDDYPDEHAVYVCENFNTFDSSISMEIALDESTRSLAFFVSSYDMLITSVTYEKIADYDIAIADFTASGIGATSMTSGAACLTVKDTMTTSEVSSMQIQCGLFTVTEGGIYDLSFIAGSKCIPSVTIYDSNGGTIATVDYVAKWNSYGVIPDYNNASTIYIESEPFYDSDSAKTVNLPAGEYRIVVQFGDNYKNNDAILVHSAYLTKVD